MTSASTRERQGLAIALLGVVGFSFSLPWTVWALESFTPVFTATGRAVIAGALAIIVLVVRRVPWPKREQVKPLLYTMAERSSAGRSSSRWPSSAPLRHTRP